MRFSATVRAVPGTDGGRLGQMGSKFQVAGAAGDGTGGGRRPVFFDYRCWS
jgi:hypothetical protein